VERGDVLSSPQHEHKDGEKSHKLLILLNNPSYSNQYVFVLTTSKQHFKSGGRGCFGNHRGIGYYSIHKGEDWFTADITYVLFNAAVILSSADVMKESWNKNNLKHAGRLKEITMTSIINCMVSSDHTRGDVVDLIKNIKPNKGLASLRLPMP
jgi:hypothetical protein